MTADTPREPVTPPTVGDGIRAMRQGLGITAAELARRASVSRSYVGDIESGRRNPTLAVALRIAAGLNRSLLDVAGLSVPDAVVDVGRSPLLIAALWEARAAGLREAPLDVERLGKAMWDALSHAGVLRIHADGWKELNDVATAVAAEYSAAPAEPATEGERL